MPSPYGMLGQQWWYLITAHSDVLADDFNNYKERDIVSGLNYAFDQLIVDTIADKHLSQSITVVVSKLNLDDDRDDFYDHSNEQFSVTTVTTQNKSDGEYTKISFCIHVWCSLQASMVSSTNAFYQVEVGLSVDSLLR